MLWWVLRRVREGCALARSLPGPNVGWWLSEGWRGEEVVLGLLGLVRRWGVVRNWNWERECQFVCGVLRGEGKGGREAIGEFGEK